MEVHQYQLNVGRTHSFFQPQFAVNLLKLGALLPVISSLYDMPTSVPDTYRILNNTQDVGYIIFVCGLYIFAHCAGLYLCSLISPIVSRL